MSKEELLELHRHVLRVSYPVALIFLLDLHIHLHEIWLLSCSHHSWQGEIFLTKKISYVRENLNSLSFEESYGKPIDVGAVKSDLVNGHRIEQLAKHRVVRISNSWFRSKHISVKCY